MDDPIFKLIIRLSFEETHKLLLTIFDYLVFKFTKRVILGLLNGIKEHVEKEL